MKRNKSKLFLILLLSLSIFFVILCGGCDQVVPKQETTLFESSEVTTETIATEAKAGLETISTEAPTETEITTESEITTETEVATESETTTETEVQETVMAEETSSKLDTVSEQLGLSIDNIEIDLPNVNDSYEILFINDMHILEVDTGVVESEVENVRMRQDMMFKTKTGIRSSEAWLQLSSILDDFSADHIIFGGDIVDFTSEANLQVLQEGLSQISTPYTYLRADHDLGTWYSGGALNEYDAVKMHTNICSYEDVYILEYPEFYVIGWNNSTSQLTNLALHNILKIWENGKPIILATHVPINSLIDNSLKEVTASADSEGRIKLWGDGCLYQPRENTSSFLGMIYHENSPVKAVFSGHLHVKHTVALTNQTTEYVLAPAFLGNIAKITIK